MIHIGNEPLSNFFPSLSIALTVKISSNTTFDEADVMVVIKRRVKDDTVLITVSMLLRHFVGCLTLTGSQDGTKWVLDE